jgi:hypothetical protein
MSVLNALFPFLPTDLEREIFELTALPGSIPKFFLTAQRAKIWY